MKRQSWSVEKTVGRSDSIDKNESNDQRRLMGGGGEGERGPQPQTGASPAHTHSPSQKFLVDASCFAAIVSPAAGATRVVLGETAARDVTCANTTTNKETREQQMEEDVGGWLSVGV